MKIDKLGDTPTSRQRSPAFLVNFGCISTPPRPARADYRSAGACVMDSALAKRGQRTKLGRDDDVHGVPRAEPGPLRGEAHWAEQDARRRGGECGGYRWWRSRGDEVRPEADVFGPPAARGRPPVAARGVAQEWAAHQV
jgi:hypothetical protein